MQNGRRSDANVKVHRVDQHPPSEARPRHLGLDFFRGLAMLIIFVAHVPDNAWDRWIPARFGFSSAAELFVFCSGLASAFAFGSVFRRHGWWMGLCRIALRVWQVYWAHIGLFLAVTVAAVLGTWYLGTKDYIGELNLTLFAQQPFEAIVRMMSLTFVPDLLNILPMYLVLLAMLPAMIGLAGLARPLYFAASIGLWLMVQITHFNLPGGVTDDWVWFFNPFAWQMLFYTGFAFGMGFLPVPPLDKPWLFRLALVILALCIPVTFWGFIDRFGVLHAIHDWLVPDAGVSTMELHALRYAHFLVLAYAALCIVWRFPRLVQGRLARLVIMIGQQSLATFMASLSLALVSGMALDLAGRNGLTLAIANSFGLVSIGLVAWIVRWFKGKPWAARATRRSRSPATKEAGIPAAPQAAE
jgi:hypothetical protein